jgi:hypothetical protein
MKKPLPALLLMGFVLLFSSCAMLPKRNSDFNYVAIREPGVLLALDAPHWSIPYSGFGSVVFSEKNELEIGSGRPSKPGDTHGALALSQARLPADGYEIEVVYRLLHQLRSLNPNPWETFWLFFSYRSQNFGKRTNYVVVKSNGIEVGKAWGMVDQSFSLTRDLPRLSENTWARLRVQVGRFGAARVFFNDELAGELPGNQLFFQSGQIGLYVEDSLVEVRSVRIKGELLPWI